MERKSSSRFRLRARKGDISDDDDNGSTTSLSRALDVSPPRPSFTARAKSLFKKPSTNLTKPTDACSTTTDSDTHTEPSQPGSSALPNHPQPLQQSSVIRLNVGGQEFSTTTTTLMQHPDSYLSQMITDGANRVIDIDGNYFIDRDGKHFGTILNFLRNGSSPLPEPGTTEWEEIESEAVFYRIAGLQKQMKAIELESYSREQRLEYLVQKLNGDESLVIDSQAKEIERMRVELQRLQYENVKFHLLSKHRYYENDLKDFAYNLLVVGVTGTGKSSSLNTLLDSHDNVVSGAQAQGTRGTTLRDGIIDDNHFVSYIDTQGLGADTSITDEMLLSHIMMSTESIMQMDIINNILVSCDLGARATPSVMANQLTLIELFSHLRKSCFLCMTKWNTNSVLSEWNVTLRKWIRKYRRANTIEEIVEDPPSYDVLYRDYSHYLLNSMAANREDAGAFAKMAIFLAFFGSRILWMYNLDDIQYEDKMDGELEPHVERMYHFYRQEALTTLRKGSTVINVSDLVFLKSNEDTMLSVATRMVNSRDLRVKMLERLALEKSNFERLKQIFASMAKSHVKQIKEKDFEARAKYLSKIGKLTGDQVAVGGMNEDRCTVS